MREVRVSECSILTALKDFKVMQIFIILLR
jgi:hypothetical protein